MYFQNLLAGKIYAKSCASLSLHDCATHEVKEHVRPDSLSSLLTKVSHRRYYLICEEVVGLQLILVDSLLSSIVETGRISRQKTNVLSLSDDPYESKMMPSLV